MNNRYKSIRRPQKTHAAPSEILTGFIVGLLLSTLAVAAFISALRDGAWPRLQASLGAGAMPVTLLFWVAGGAVIALLFTAGFALTARMVVNVRLRSVEPRLGTMPVTGDEDEQD